MKIITLCLFSVLIAVAAMAEFRTWTDKNGNELEATLVGTSGTDIILKKTDDTQITFSPLLLCDEDLEYLKDKVPADLLDPDKSALDRPKPPRLDVKVSKLTNTVKDSDLVNRDITLVVKIRKRSLDPYTGKLSAEMFLVGIHKDDEYLVLLDRTKVDFDLADSDKAELQGNAAHIRYYENRDAGVEYEGNVVVIRDEDGNVLDVSGSNRTFERAYEALSEFSRDDVFTEKSFRKKGTRSSMNDSKKNNMYL